MEPSLINLRTQTRRSNPIYFDFDQLEKTQRAIQVYPPNLYSILDRYGPLPAFSMVVGLSAGGMPFTLNLENSRSGSILVVGDRRDDKTQLMKVIGHSVSLINHHQEVSYYIITDKTNDYLEMLSYPNCKEILSAEYHTAGGLINNLASLAAQRRIRGEHGSQILLFIDDLSSISNWLNDFNIYLNFQSLIQRGPSCGIWPIVSSSNRDVQHVKPQLVRGFDTYIFDKYTPATESATPDFPEISTQGIHGSRFDVIIKGRLIPIDNLTI